MEISLKHGARDLPGGTGPVSAVLHHGQRVLGWRTVPTDPSAIGPVARESMPYIEQLFIGREGPADAFDSVNLQSGFSNSFSSVQSPNSCSGVTVAALTAAWVRMK